MEIVAEVIKKWGTWPDEFRHGVRLCAKHNFVYVSICSVVSCASVPLSISKHHCCAPGLVDCFVLLLSIFLILRTSVLFCYLCVVRRPVDIIFIFWLKAFMLDVVFNTS